LLIICKRIKIRIFFFIYFLPRPLINRCREKRSRSAIAACLLLFLVLVVILPIVLIIIALTGSTINFVASISNSTTARHAINLIVPPTNDNLTKSGSNETTNTNSNNFNFLNFIKGGKNATFHLFERLLMQRDTITDVVQLFGGKALSVISTVAGATAQVSLN
jgi:predicted PurR-regulated permease PerM